MPMPLVLFPSESERQSESEGKRGEAKAEVRRNLCRGRGDRTKAPSFHKTRGSRAISRSGPRTCMRYASLNPGSGWSWCLTRHAEEISHVCSAIFDRYTDTGERTASHTWSTFQSLGFDYASHRDMNEPEMVAKFSIDGWSQKRPRHAPLPPHTCYVQRKLLGMPWRS